jgi:hypothetical protein
MSNHYGARNSERCEQGNEVVSEALGGVLGSIDRGVRAAITEHVGYYLGRSKILL